MEPKTLAEKNDFQKRFSPLDYLSTYSLTPGTPENALYDFTMKNVHQGFKELKNLPSKIRVLDFGCGPVISHAISAAGIPNVSEIVMAEYTARNREAVQQWLDKDPSSFNWSPYFKHVVQTLEGKTEQEVAEREERLRSLVKVVSCDISQVPPIERGYEGPYDILISSLCLDSCCENVDEYYKNVAKLSTLLKPGGFLLFVSTDTQPEDESTYYLVGTEYFYDLKFSRDVVISALKGAGFTILSEDRLEFQELKDGSKLTNCDKFMFVLAEKKEN